MDEINTTSQLNENAEPVVTDEEIAKWDADRAERDQEALASCVVAAETRKQNATVIAEHDDAIAEALFEITLINIGEEV